MKNKIRILIGIAFALSSLPSHAKCGEDELRFLFDNLHAAKAFSILSDFSGLELDIDATIARSGPIEFDCMHWEKAAAYLAEEFDLKVTIEDGVIHVRR